MTTNAGEQRPRPHGERVLLSEWAGDTRAPRPLGSGADRPACPICGHPTMDCTHDTPLPS